MGRRKVKMDIIHPHAAGIDIGSRSHYVAIGQTDSEVKEFGVFAEDNEVLAKWLKQHNVKTVAMESTGTYWQNLYLVLQEKGFEVILANGKFTKNIKGRKTDVQDCQWIQKLHTLGLLTGSFLPDDQTEQLRTYCRQRTAWLNQGAAVIQKMQKFLRLLNLRLDVAVTDIAGLTGLKIIDAICKGITDPKELSKLVHRNCKKSPQEIARALNCNHRQDLLFGLKQEYETYKFIRVKIEECDNHIKIFIDQHFNQNPELKELEAPKKIYKKRNKNAPKNMDLNQISYQYFGGVDLMTIEGVSDRTVIALMSELGPQGFKKFPTYKHFTSWLRLAPNNKISGGKKLSRRVGKGSNNVKIALRRAANVIGNLKDSHLGQFFRRIAYRKGRVAAITATARKLVVIIWKMVVEKVPYNPPEPYLFRDQKRSKMLKELKKKINKLNISPMELGLNISNLE
ncbi:IS110 family RNA-guided transposase [Portibacter marinus]|uniref:IS110 family transposase n=1 Tax=Portibacter marinus TaxID=2898660 RepID=UPI001F3A1B5A|nr:IS110 family transposase [Portibacter marinus]